MASEEMFKLVQCALGQDGHLLKNAIGLSCGHFICKKCIPANDFFGFKCHKCNEVNLINLGQCKEATIISFYMENHLGDLSKLINEKLEIELDILQSKIQNEIWRDNV